MFMLLCHHFSGVHEERPHLIGIGIEIKGSRLKAKGPESDGEVGVGSGDFSLRG